MTKRPKRAADPGAIDPERLFGKLRSAQGVILAVSGGADSTALMVLFSQLAARPPAVVVSVDHGIRPEAAAEARGVADNATRLGLPCRIMRAVERPPTGNLQDWARRARYACLAEAARTEGFDAILTAHHMDDQAETFLMRLARGSGAYGLRAIPDEIMLEGGLRVVRPLLGVPRAALARVAADSALPLADDPGNRDATFERVRLRSFIPELAGRGITAQRLAETAGRLGRAAAALDHYAQALLRADFTVDDLGSLGGRAAALGEVPDEVSLRALALIFRAVGGADYTPRLDRLERIREAILKAGDHDRVGRTLHGVALHVTRGTLVARREWGRRGPPRVAAQAGATLLWDGRFRIVVPSRSGALSVGPLGHGNLPVRSGRDRASIRMLPGVFAGTELVAIPDRIAAPGEALPGFAAECIVAGRLGLAPAATPPAN